MKSNVVWLGLFVAAAMLLTGCESDSTPSDVTFRNDSTHAVTVRLTVQMPDTSVRTFTLQPGGEEWKTLKIFADPLEYTYTPTAQVADRRDGRRVYFENR
jgi:hypothetical protein